MYHLFLLLCTLEIACSYKILVYNAQVAHSHVAFMGRIADTLAKAGHDVLVYVPAFVDQVNTTGASVARAIVNPRDFKLDIDQEAFFGEYWKEDQVKPAQMFKMTHTMTEHMTRLCRSQLDNKEMIAKLKKENFDLGIGEVFDACSMVYFEAIGLDNHIAASSVCMMDLFLKPFGLMDNPSYVPAMVSSFTDEMSYTERAANLAIQILVKVIDTLVIKPPFISLVHEKFGADFDFGAKVARSSFIFVNSEELLEFPREITHKIVYIGGIGVQKPKALDKNFGLIMDKAVNGAIFISFGSNVKSSVMPEAIKMAFLRTFRKFPKITFIWKYEIDDDIGIDIPNLIKVKWAPQNDLFGHPNLRAFISHGGINSITECTHAGIPIIAIPIFGDQMRNARTVEKRGMAIVLNKHSITVESLSEAVKDIITNRKYYDSAKRLQGMILKKPTNATERIIKYAEFAAEFGPFDNLDLAVTKLYFFQQYLLDILIPFLFIIVLAMYLALRLVSCTFHKICRRRKRKRE